MTMNTLFIALIVVILGVPLCLVFAAGYFES
jgi:hypothetical protein